MHQQAHHAAKELPDKSITYRRARVRKTNPESHVETLRAILPRVNLQGSRAAGEDKENSKRKKFTHLPSRTLFIDNDRYMGEDWLAHWIAHELGHLAKNSPKEEDAEKAAAEFRKRLKEARGQLQGSKIAGATN